MAARSTRGPGGGRSGGRRPPASRGGGRGSSSSGCAMVAVPIAAALVLGMSLILVAPAVPVWTAAYIPAANRVHYGDALIVLMVLAGFGLYIAVSLLQTRRTYSPAGSPVGVPGLSRPGTDAAGVVLTSPGSTPAAT